MKLLNEIQSTFENNGFELEHESNMVQSRLLSPIIEVIEERGITQAELSESTGLKQPFISALLNVRKKLNMEHIALFQKALGIVLQTPQALSTNEHKHKFYNKEEYDIPSVELFEENFNVQSINNYKQYTKSKKEVIYTRRKLSAMNFSNRMKESTSDRKFNVISI